MADAVFRMIDHEPAAQPMGARMAVIEAHGGPEPHASPVGRVHHRDPVVLAAFDHGLKVPDALPHMDRFGHFGIDGPGGLGGAGIEWAGRT